MLKGRVPTDKSLRISCRLSGEGSQALAFVVLRAGGVSRPVLRGGLRGVVAVQKRVTCPVLVGQAVVGG